MVGRLAPETVGTYTMAVLIVSFLASFGDLGLVVSLLRRRHVSRRLALRAMRWTVVAGCLLSMVALGLGSVLVVAGKQSLGLFVIVMSLRLLLDGLVYIPTGVAQRNLLFRFLAVRDAAAAACGTLAGIAVAYSPFAEWCLPVAALTPLAVSALFSPIALRGLGVVANEASLRKTLPFARHITTQQVFKYVTQSGDVILVGTILGGHALGQYRVAQRLGLEAASLIRIGIGSLMLPELVKTRLPQSHVIMRVQRALLAIVGPVAVLIGTTSGPLVDVLLGDQWLRVGNLLSFMCAVALLQTFLFTVGETMKAAGRGGLLLWWTVAATVMISVAVVAGSLVAGLTGLTVAYVGVYLLLVPVGLGIQHRLSGVGTRHVVWGSRGVLLSLVLLAVVAIGVRTATDLSSLATLVLSWGLGGIVYVALLVLLDRPIVRYVVGRAP